MAAKNIIKEKEASYHQYKVLGIVTQISIHRLAWLLNHEFDWDLVRIGDILLIDNSSILVKNQKELEENEHSIIFPIHYYDAEGDKFEMDLINNKNGSNVFIKELKQFDYLIVFHGEFDYLPPNLLEKINQLTPIQIAVNIDHKIIKNKNLLLSYR